jgi:hypothetical protein
VDIAERKEDVKTQPRLTDQEVIGEKVIDEKNPTEKPTGAQSEQLDKTNRTPFKS